MISFREKLVTDERTDGRTNGSESIGPTSKVGGSKNESTFNAGVTQTLQQKSVHFFPKISLQKPQKSGKSV